MKNKSVTYLLIGVVVLIWGLIVNRIFNASQEEDLPMPRSSKAISETPKENSTQADQFELILDYRDPFMGKMSFGNSSVSSKKHGGVPKKAKVIQVVSQVAPIDWSFVVYLGAINNKQQNTKIGMFRLYDKEVVLRAEESRGEVKVLKIMRDTAWVQYQGIKKGLSKSQ